MDNNKKKFFKLKNGIRVIIIPMNTLLTSISVNMLLGQNHEKYNEMEITHYMEHLMARFTSNKHSDHKKISKELNKRGAVTNAYVDDYDTCFYIEGLYKDIEYYIDILSNTISNFHLEKSIMKQEKLAVVQELKKITANPEYFFDFKIWKYMYPKYAYQYDINKHIKKVQTYTSDDIYKFIETHVLPQNTIVSITCPLNKCDETTDLARKYFNFPNTKSHLNIRYPLYQHNNNKLKILYVQNNYKKNTNANVQIVVDNSIKHLSKEHLSLLFLEEILFNFETGIFYKRLRDELGLIYNILIDFEIDMVNPRSSSYFIKTSVEQNNVAQLIKAILDIVSNLTLNENEIENGKTKFIVKYEYHKFNNLTSYNKHYGKYLLHDIPIVERSDIKEKSLAVTHCDVIKTFQKFKREVLTKGLIFYYCTKNQNQKIKSSIKIPAKYISL